MDLTQETIDNLKQLAEIFVENKKAKTKIIVPFVGAGASAAAGILNGEELRNKIYNELIGDDSDNRIVDILDYEVSNFFPDKADNGILQLSLFEFASIICQFSYGRKIISEVIENVIKEHSRIPLAYELIAHLSKHEYIDHIVSLNYDDILDESLKDELTESHCQCIASSDDVPKRNAADKLVASKVCIIKPFGSISTGVFRLVPSELVKYGAEPVFDFLINHILAKPSGDKRPEIVIILVGYAAAEQAFFELIKTLDRRNQKVTIFAIDYKTELSSELLALNTKHIRLDTENSFSLLLELIRRISLSRGNHIWCPVARHNIVSRYIESRLFKNNNIRFQIEVILQAVKSRGFFTVNALNKLLRIQNYSKNAIISLTKLQSNGLINIKDTREDYELTTTDFNQLATLTLNLFKIAQDSTFSVYEIPSHNLSDLTIKKVQYNNLDYLASQFEIISSGPEIEIGDSGWSATQWLFSNVKIIKSLEALTQTTAGMLERLLLCDFSKYKIEFFGIWATGEWLFHEKGWAFSFGNQILEQISQGNIKANMIFIKPDNSETQRKIRGNEVIEYLMQITGEINIYKMDWWQQNRKFTFVRIIDKTTNVVIESEGIYFRRRLATPLVSPVYIKGEHNCMVLDKIFDRYMNKSGSIKIKG